mgnify:CR=1 FL=1
MGKSTPDRVSEQKLEGFLGVKQGDESVYDFAEPHQAPHGQMLSSMEDKGWNPAQFSLDKDSKPLKELINLVL